MGVKKENYTRKFWEKGEKQFSQAFLSFAGIKKKLLVSKLVSTFDHETPEIATKTDFHECSRNEFSWSAYETSAPDFFFSPYECLRNEFSRNEFSSLAHETSVHDTIFNSCITHPDINRLQKSAFMTSY